jgi:hypothetical protein
MYQTEIQKWFQENEKDKMKIVANTAAINKAKEQIELIFANESVAII